MKKTKLIRMKMTKNENGENDKQNENKKKMNQVRKIKK